MKFVTWMVSKSHPGNKFHDINLAVRKLREHGRKTKLRKHRHCDFMKFVTRMVSKRHPGNKFHEINVAVRTQREHEQENNT